MTGIKVYDETYTFEVYTEKGERHVFCSYDGATGWDYVFKTREELIQSIADYILQCDYVEQFVKEDNPVLVAD